MKTQNRMEEKVFSYIEEQGLLREGDRVILGVSGGADSVCLLFVLLEYAARKTLQLGVVHVHHGIRKEADEDAAYVEQLCREHGISFFQVKEDVKQKAKEWKCSEEEAGRNVRYQAFADAAGKFGADKIAVAHNANDRAETFLFHLFRGSDLKGLGSIRPMRDRIIRPLLCLERKEIEAYLKDRGIAYCQDLTNHGDDYTRNRIRHHILPYAEREIAVGSVAHVAHAAQIISETEDYLEQQTMVAAAGCVRFDHGDAGACTIDTAALRKLHPLMQRRVLYMTLQKVTGSARDLTYVHVESLRELSGKEGYHSISLPYGVVAESCYDRIFLRKGVASEDGTPYDLWAKVEMRLREGSCEEILGCSAEEYVDHMMATKTKEVGQNEYTKCFDYDKIKQSMLSLRNRKMGDYLTLAGPGDEMIHKSLKDYMITEKIPKPDRDRIPVLAEGNHVVWLVGYRISEYYKINVHTKRVLQVQLICKDEDPETK